MGGLYGRAVPHWNCLDGSICGIDGKDLTWNRLLLVPLAESENAGNVLLVENVVGSLAEPAIL